MLTRIACSVLVITPWLVAADPVTNPALQNLTVSHTDTLALPAGGALHVEHSYGEVSIEGWDRKDVEITVVKTTQEFFSAKDSHATAELERVHVAAAVEGKDVVVNTERKDSDIAVDYRIKVPRDAPIFVHHGKGEVHFYDITGDVHAYVHNGSITVDVAPEARYTVDAGSKWGHIISDYPGRPHRRIWVIGRQLIGDPEGAPRQLDLKTFYGDIIVFKNWKPAATK